MLLLEKTVLACKAGVQPVQILFTALRKCVVPCIVSFFSNVFVFEGQFNECLPGGIATLQSPSVLDVLMLLISSFVVSADMLVQVWVHVALFLLECKCVSVCVCV